MERTALTGATQKGFRVGVTRDILRADGSHLFDLSLLEEDEDVELSFLAEGGRDLRPEQILGYDGLVVFTSYVTTETLEDARRLQVIARLGVGYDRIDVSACTDHGVLLTLARDAVRRPMASSAVALVLALAHRLLVKDRQLRSGQWDRFADPGTGLAGRTLGLIGLGNVGREVASLIRPFDMRVIATDPEVDAATVDVELVSLDTLLRDADFVCVTCPLNAQTYHLLDGPRIALMKPSAFLINIARGPIVDQRALTNALRVRDIAGAGLDVFEEEPIAPDNPLLGLDNVILTPHSIGHLDQTFRDSGRSASRSILAVCRGEMPEFVVNPEALDRRASR